MPLPVLPPSASPPLPLLPARDVRTECAKTEGARTGGQAAQTALHQSRAHFAPVRAPPRRSPARHGRRHPAGSIPANRGRAGLQLDRRGTAHQSRARRLAQGQRHEIHAGPGASQRGCCCAVRPAHTDSPAVAPEAAIGAFLKRLHQIYNLDLPLGFPRVEGINSKRHISTHHTHRPHLPHLPHFGPKKTTETTKRW